MPSFTVQQWEDLNWVLERCEQVHIPHDFGVMVVNAVRRIFSYDQARVYFFDDAGAIYDQYLIGVSQKVIKEYHGRYAHTDNELYEAEGRARSHALLIAQGKRRRYEPMLMDWERESHTTVFYREHMASQDIRWCTGLALFDMADRVRVLYSLDRLSNRPKPSTAELQLLGFANQHLDALYRNFFVEAPLGQASSIALSQSDLPLTRREVEVAKLLLDGLSAKSVAHTLGISQATVYKHISNMHTKLGVNNQAALLHKLRGVVAVQSD